MLVIALVDCFAVLAKSSRSVRVCRAAAEADLKW